MSSLLTARRSPFLQWGAAALTAAALYAVPYALLGVLASGRSAAPFLGVDLAVLLAAALWLWSPLVVLAATVLSGVGFFLAWAIGGSDACGGSAAAGWLEAAGALALGLPLGAWGVRRGARALAVIPLAWVAAGLWILLVAHVLPGGSGACFD